MRAGEGRMGQGKQSQYTVPNTNFDGDGLDIHRGDLSAVNQAVTNPGSRVLIMKGKERGHSGLFLCVAWR